MSNLSPDCHEQLSLYIGQLFFAGIGMFQLSRQDCDPIQTYIPSYEILCEVPGRISIPAGMFEFHRLNQPGIPPRSSFCMGGLNMLMASNYST